MPTLREKKWWPSIALTPIFVSDSVVTVPSVAGLHVKQKISLMAPGVTSQEFEIKRILNRTQLQVGPLNKPLTHYLNPIEFNGGTLYAVEQNRNPIDAEAILRAVYLEEPAVAIRNVLVDQYGDYIDSVQDSQGRRRLAVDANVSIGSLTVDIDSPNQITVHNINITSASTEYVFALPLNTKCFGIRVRDGAATLNISFEPNQSGTNYIKVNRGSTWYSGAIDINEITPLNVYYQTNVANVIVEIIIWKRS